MWRNGKDDIPVLNEIAVNHSNFTRLLYYVCGSDWLTCGMSVKS